MRGFVAKPAGAGPWPALIVIHAIMGIDDHLERIVEGFAAEGYVTAAPDIYAKDSGYKQHSHDDIEIAAHMGADAATQHDKLAQYSAEQQARIVKARDWMNARPGHTYINTIRAAYDALAARSDLRGIGAIGFCMGGRLVGELVATGAALAAGVIHYGSPPKLDLVPAILAPLEGHYASRPICRSPTRFPTFAATIKAAWQGLHLLRPMKPITASASPRAAYAFPRSARAAHADALEDLSRRVV